MTKKETKQLIIGITIIMILTVCIYINSYKELQRKPVNTSKYKAPSRSCSEVIGQIINLPGFKSSLSIFVAVDEEAFEEVANIQEMKKDF